MSGSRAREERDERIRKLKEQWAAEERRKKGKKGALIAGIIAVVLLLIIGGGFGIKHLADAEKDTKARELPTSQPYLEFGAETDDAPVVDVYLDFMCPGCGAFHQMNGSDLDKIIKNKDAQVRIHPRNFMDVNSTNKYSTRATNAFATVYEDENPHVALKFHDLLFNNQPEEGTDGLSDEQIGEFAKQAGASSETVEDIKNDRYVDWVNDVVEKDANQNAPGGTPAIFVNDKMIEDWQEQGAFKDAVKK